jgi:LysM repeat protein
MNMSRRLSFWRWAATAGLLISLVLAAPVGRVGAQAGSSTVHMVEAGENLFRIALRYGTTVDAIMQANNLSSSQYIYAGQSLVIPAGASGSSTSSGASAALTVYTVQWGDTLSAIAVRHGVTLWSLLQANGLSSSQAISAGQRLVIPAGGSSSSTSASATTYTVHAGDTLSAIAQRYSTTAFELARLNGINSPSSIFVGQVLHLPIRPTPTPAPTATVPTYTGAKRILVNLTQQHLYAYQGDSLVYSFVCSSGAAPYYTRTGTFAVQSKIPNAYGGTWGIWMPHWLGIYWAGASENGIHALPILANGQTLWAGYLGRPVSYGCIVLGTYNARLLYDWADMGTPVTIRY